jgi:hypothetical protein
MEKQENENKLEIQITFGKVTLSTLGMYLLITILTIVLKLTSVLTGDWFYILIPFYILLFKSYNYFFDNEK